VVIFNYYRAERMQLKCAWISVLCVCVCVCVCVRARAVVFTCHKTYEIYFGNFILYRNDETFLTLFTYTLFATCLEIASSDKRRAKPLFS
jgi:hypothetical protein